MGLAEQTGLTSKHVYCVEGFWMLLELDKTGSGLWQVLYPLQIMLRLSHPGWK